MSEISDIMSTNVVTVGPDMTILEATNVLTKYDITGLPVVDKKKRLLGIVSEKDLLQLAYGLKTHTYASDDSPKTVEDVMTKEVIAFDEEDPLSEVIKCLMDGDFRRVPILSGGKLVGIISRRDLLVCNLLV
jgi:acetoin utilization protein AcuB